MKNYIPLLSFFLILGQSAYASKTWQSLSNYVSGSQDPTVTALNFPQGTVYFRNSGSIYIKQDDFLSLNWSCINCSSGGGGTWGTITGTLSNQTDLQTALNGKQSSLTFSPPLVNTAGTVAINGDVADNALDFVNSSDATKKTKLDLSAQTTGTTVTLTPQSTSNQVIHLPPVATASGAAMALLQDETTGFIFSNGITSSIGAANSMMQLANASTANRAQIKLHSYFNGTSVAGVSTLTSRSGTIGTNAAVVAGQDYSKWTAQAGATTPGSAPISGAWAFKANTVNSLTVTSDFHLQLTNLAGTLADRFYLTSEGIPQFPALNVAGGYVQTDGSGNLSSATIPNADATHTGFLTSAKYTTFQDTTNQVTTGAFHDLYVRNSFTNPNSETLDCSVLRPCAKVQDAVNQIISNNDGGVYVIRVGAGIYPDAINLNNAALNNLAIVADVQANAAMSNDAIDITQISGDINSTSNNAGIRSVMIRGFDITGNINFTGDTNGTTFCQYGCVFSGNTLYPSNTAYTFNNASQIIWDGIGSAIVTGTVGLNVTNVNSFLCYHSFVNIGTFALVTNSGANKPTGFSATSAQTSFGNLVSNTTIDASSSLVQRYERVAGTINNSGTLTSISSSYSGVVTNQVGSTWSSTGDNVSTLPTLLAGFAGKAYRFDKGMFLNGAIAPTNGVLAYKDGHIVSTQTTAPTATVNANAGTGATCTVSADATDSKGTITLTTTAVSPATGEQCKVNFNKSYNNNAHCNVSPIDQNGGLVNVTSQAYFPSTTGVVAINYGVLDAAGHASNWTYQCQE